VQKIGQITKWKRNGTAAALAYLLFLGLSTALVSRPLENIVRDVMIVSISPFTHPPPNIVVVAITEQTLSRFPYRSPVDRGFLADVVARIEAAGPRVIGVDLLFDQETEPSKDTRLEAVIDTASVPVVIASASQIDGLTQKQTDYLNAFAPSAKRGLAVLSHDNLDSVVRGVFPGREVADGWKPSFVAAIGAAVGITSSRRPAEMIYYRAENGTPFKFPAYPAQAVALAPLSWFQDKYVLIGVDLPQQDRHPTPFTLLSGPDEGALPGVIIHAHSLASLLSGEKITTLWPGAEFALLLVPGLFSFWVAWRPMPVVFKPIAIGGALLLVWIGEAFAFAQSAILVPTVAPTFLIVGLSAFIAFLAWRRDAMERQFIQSAFSKYVSPAVVAAIIRKPAALSLGGESRVVTSVFTDLQGFTQFSEGLAPDVLAGILNEYLDGVCNLFIGHGATIDKVVGDAVVGFFGAPAAQADQAERAVALTLAVEDFAQRLRAQISERGFSLGVTRIGVHCGPAIVGNFGGNRFFNYTAVGDTVNIAARLEGANKVVGTKNCISSQVATQTRGFLLRQVGVLYLMGKSEGVTAFEALSNSVENKHLCEEYSKAQVLLVAKDSRAGAAFERLVKKYPQDGLIVFHQRRLAGGICRADIQFAEK
jgi:adenylate cyclase